MSKPRINQLLYICKLKSKDVACEIDVEKLSKFNRLNQKQTNVAVIILNSDITIKVSHRGCVFVFVRGSDLIYYHNNIQSTVESIIKHYILDYVKTRLTAISLRIINVHFRIATQKITDHKT